MTYDPKSNSVQAAALMLCVEPKELSYKLNDSISKTEWQPIATAPKDGTEILVYDYHNDTQKIILVSYSYAFEDWTICWSDTHYEINPTHWMPLPELPTQ